MTIAGYGKDGKMLRQENVPVKTPFVGEIDKDLYDDLQKDHVEALGIIMNGMILRQLNSSQILKNLSNFFCYVERVHRHFCFTNGKISLNDLDMDILKLEF